MSEKLQIAINRIATDISLADLTSSLEKKKYKLQELNKSKISGFDLKLYYQNNKSTPKWKGFLNPLVKPEQAILKDMQGRDERFILLLQNASNQKIYAVTGGFGFTAIQDYIDDNFGMDVFSRLITKEEKILKSSKERSVVGGIIGTAKYFRNNFTLFENDGFGKIYKEVTADLKKEILVKKLGFTADEINKESVCIAKSTFKINKTINFDQLIKIITGCEDIIANEEAIVINSVERLQKKRHQALIQKLLNELLKQLWDRYQGIGEFDFDLCAGDFEDYLSADTYVITKGTSPKNFFGEDDLGFEETLANVDVLFERLKQSGKGPANEEAFIKLMYSLRIRSFDENGAELTDGNLLDHVFGDVEIVAAKNTKRYFYIDGVWYEIKQSFIDGLNVACGAFLNKHYVDGLNEKWNPAEIENQYNRKYIGTPNAIVLDKVTTENIELCDIMKWDDNNLYLYHVKVGFTNTTRDLCEQISIASRRLQADLSSDRSFIKKVYLSLQNKSDSTDEYFKSAGAQTKQYTEEFFLDLFKKTPIFVLAVADAGGSERKLRTEIANFRSNIAKFSLEKLFRDMRGFDIELKATQIWRI